MKRKIFSLGLLAVMLVALTVPCFASDVFDGYRYDYSNEYVENKTYSSSSNLAIGYDDYLLDVFAPKCVFDVELNNHVPQKGKNARFSFGLIRFAEESSYLYIDWYPEWGNVKIAYWDNSASQNVVFDNDKLPAFADVDRVLVTLSTDADRRVYSNGKYTTKIHSVHAVAEIFYNENGEAKKMVLEMPSDLSTISNIDLWNNYLSNSAVKYDYMIYYNAFSFRKHLYMDYSSCDLKMHVQSFPDTSSVMGNGSMLTRTIGIAMVAVLIGGGVLLVVKLRSNRRRR